MNSARALNANDKKSSRIPLILILLIFTAPIYWLPGIPRGYYTQAKDFILFVFVLIPFLKIFKNVPLFPRVHDARLIFFGLFLLIFFSLPGAIVVSDNKKSAFSSYIRYLIILPLFLHICSIFERNPQKIEKIFKLIAIPIIISSILIFLASFGIISYNPPGFTVAARTKPYVMGLSYRTAGMSWSIAYIMPILVYFAIKSEKKLFWLIALALAIYAHILQDNRGGLLAAAFAGVFVFLTLVGTAKTWWKYLLLSIIIYFILIDGGKLMVSILSREQVHEQILTERREDFDSLNELSNGRLGKYADGLEIIKRYPIFGSGFSRAQKLQDFTGIKSGFHNFYFNHIVATGFVGGFFLMIFFFLIVKLIFTKYFSFMKSKRNDFIVVPIGMLISHFFNTMVESGQMFNNVHQGISFWFALAALAIIPVKSAYPATVRQRIHGQMPEELQQAASH